MFTAPYRLCEGGCKSDMNNFVMAFPLFVGAKGKAAYKNSYKRDHWKIHSRKPNAPFREKPTRAPVTPCPTGGINKNSSTDIPNIIYKDTSESLERNTPQMIVLDDSEDEITTSDTTTQTTVKLPPSSPQTSITCPKLFPRLCIKKKHISNWKHWL